MLHECTSVYQAVFVIQSQHNGLKISRKITFMTLTALLSLPTVS